MVTSYLLLRTLSSSSHIIKVFMLNSYQLYLVLVTGINYLLINKTDI